MTSLIDVIFLLLLFFMLSSTFSKFAEVELTTGARAAGADGPTGETLFLQLDVDGMALNGQATEESALLERLRALDAPPTVLISLSADTNAQMLTDALGLLRQIPELTLTVLEPAT